MEKRGSRGRARGREGKIQCSNTQGRGRGRGRGQRQPRPFDISRDTERPGAQLRLHSDQQLTEEDVSLSQQSQTALSVAPIHQNLISKSVNVSCEVSAPLNRTATQSHHSESVLEPATDFLEEHKDDTSHTLACLPSLEASTSFIPPASKPLSTISTVTQDDTPGSNDLDKKQPPNRPGFGKQGKEIMVRANFFPVELPPHLTLHHYEVTINRDYPKQLCKRIFQDLEIKYSSNVFDGQKCVFDGQKKLYCQKPLQIGNGKIQLRNEFEGEAITVILKYVNTLSVHTVSILQDTTERMPLVEVLDIIMRHLPSMKTEPIDGFSFSCPDHPQNAGQGLEAWPGYYQSIRPTMGWKFMLNLDTSLKAFYTEQSVIDFMCSDATRELSAQAHEIFRGPLKKNRLKKIKGLKIQTTHLSSLKEYEVVNVSHYSAQEQFIPKIECTVAEHCKKRYDKELKYPHLPCLYVKSHQYSQYLPLEFCQIMAGQHCGKNLKSVQKLLKELESDLEEEIKKRLAASGITQDPVLKDFGISVSDKMVEIPTRVLDPPPLIYGCDQTVRPPQDKGSWEVRGSTRFYRGAQINGYAVLVFSKKISKAEIDRFTKKLESIGSERGLIFQGEKIVQLEILEQTKLIEKKFKSLKTRVHLIIAIIDKGSHVYNTIKFIGNTTIPGLATQCVTTTKIQECMRDVIKNICLEINLKLGGIKNIIDSSARPAFFQREKEPVIIFGAAVTHPRAGDTTSPSIAAVVASMDLTQSKFKDKHNRQKDRQEITNLKEMATNLFLDFSLTNGEKKPSQIIFYRNGENGREFNEVYFKEIEALQQACRELKPDNPPGITFIVVQNCPRIHLFPVDHEDRGKSNRIPVGTIVEHEITHPDEFGFYLCSHASGQPCHYRVLWDDNGLLPDDLQTFSYQLCHTWSSDHSALYPAPIGYARQAAAHARALLLGCQECVSSDTESEDSCDAGESIF